MQAVYRFGKITSKYIILEVIGFSDYREQAGKLLMSASGKLRRLMQRNFSIFLNLTVREEAEWLEEIRFNRASNYKTYFNIFTPAATSRLFSWLIKG